MAILRNAVWMFLLVNVCAWGADEPSLGGKVERFLLAPRGEVDGFLLRDGTRVKFPPHMSTALVETLRPGETVTLLQYRGMSAPTKHGRGVTAISIRNEDTGRTVVEQPPSRSPAVIGESEGDRMVAGNIARFLLNDHGDPDGVLLADGREVRFPPPMGAHLLDLYQRQPKALIEAEGPSFRSRFGFVTDAIELNYGGVPVLGTEGLRVSR